MKKSQLKKLIKEAIEEVKMESILENGHRSIEIAEKLLEGMGIPRLSLEEKKRERKKLYDQIMKESNNQPPIDSKRLLEEAKNIASGNF
jgi:TRAP-type C4-dicarboxylate transport system substrate-binding protein